MGDVSIKHYSSSHQILLVGEGDFSFSACLANAFSSATNMVATSLDDYGNVIDKHPTARQNLRLLERRGCRIIHQVDARTMSSHWYLGSMKFDRIVFNFPHAGFCTGMREKDYIHILRHKELVKSFFENARYMLKRDGEIHVTHKTHYPFSMWGIRSLGEGAGLSLVNEVVFDKDDYPGYENKKGDGVGSNDTFPIRQCSTYKFRLGWPLKFSLFEQHEFDIRNLFKELRSSVAGNRD